MSSYSWTALLPDKPSLGACGFITSPAEPQLRLLRATCRNHHLKRFGLSAS